MKLIVFKSFFPFLTTATPFSISLSHKAYLSLKNYRCVLSHSFYQCLSLDRNEFLFFKVIFFLKKAHLNWTYAHADASASLSLRLIWKRKSDRASLALIHLSQEKNTHKKHESSWLKSSGGNSVFWELLHLTWKYKTILWRWSQITKT